MYNSISYTIYNSQTGASVPRLPSVDLKIAKWISRITVIRRTKIFLLQEAIEVMVNELHHIHDRYFQIITFIGCVYTILYSYIVIIIVYKMVFDIIDDIVHNIV